MTKDKISRDRRRAVYQNHSFECKINEKNQSLYIRFDNYDSFCKQTTKARNNGLDTFRYSEGDREWFLETGYAEFCIEKYNNIPDNYDEALLEYEAKKHERMAEEIRQEAYKSGLLRYKKSGGWQFTNGRETLNDKKNEK
tara:strand:+ start:3437 stop:3856 length:420 start_codon:yes stop_codon:yes gene_type:complete